MNQENATETVRESAVREDQLAIEFAQLAEMATRSAPGVTELLLAYGDLESVRAMVMSFERYDQDIIPTLSTSSSE